MNTARVDPILAHPPQKKRKINSQEQIMYSKPKQISLYVQQKEVFNSIKKVTMFVNLCIFLHLAKLYICSEKKVYTISFKELLTIYDMLFFE